MMLNCRLWNRCGIVSILAACCLGILVGSLHAADPVGDGAHWYKGNTHAHSLWSDGDDFPEMVADWYKSHGYDFLAISDHNKLMAGEHYRNIDSGDKDKPVPSSVVKKCQKRFGDDWLSIHKKGDQRQVKLKTFDEVCDKLAEPEKFLLIPNEEISARHLSSAVHVNALNLAEAIARKEGTSVVDTIAANVDAVAEQSRRLNRPMLAHVNHPNWTNYDITAEDLAQVSSVKFFEVCNGSPGIRNLGNAIHPSTEKLWDIANTIRIAKMKAAPLFCVAGDDSHRYHHFAPDEANPGRGWIVVRAKHLDAGDLIDAMNRGDFYASTGVVLRDVVYDAKERTLTVTVKAEPGVHYSIEFIGTPKDVDPTGTPAKVVSKSGKSPKRPLFTYSPKVGKVLSSVQGDSGTYKFTGKELYVRAVVRSDKPIRNATKGEMQKQEAWCQPVGWEQR